jgi:class 3 adenylate cyclase
MLMVLFRVQHTVLLLGLALLSLYLHMSVGQFALLALAAVVAQEVYAVFTVRHFQRHLEPVVAWIGSDRRGERASEAWRCAASLPFELLRQWWRGGYPFAAGLAWCLFATWLLKLPGYAIPILFAAVSVGTTYGNALGFFAAERALEPVLDDIATELSEESEASAISMPLSRRLLSALPALNVITAFAVVGFVAGDHAGIGRIAAAVFVSIAVALTLTFGLSVLLASSVVAPITRLQEATTRVARGDLTTRVPVVASDETGALTRAFNRMVSGLQERERLREAFGTFVDPELAERVAREGTDLRGEEVDVSIVFLDVRGFTTFAERTPAPEVVARLNALYEVVVPIILAHGGHANKFIGDGLLAVFGAPERHADHADRAVGAAIDIAEQVRQRQGDDLRVGLGVNSGSVVVGTIGGGGRLDFTVIGDVVNTAARVESATRETGDDVLITEAARQRLGRVQVEWAERPPIPLKGKSEAIRLYAPSKVEDSR